MSMHRKHSMKHLSKHKDTEIPTVINVSTKEGKVFQLTEKKLEKWFAQIEQHHQNKSSKKDGQLADIYVGRYGLQSTQDVIRYLKSPEGKDTLALINEQLAEMLALDELEHEEEQERQTRRKIALAAFLMALIYRKKAWAHHLNEAYQNLIAAIHDQLQKIKDELTSSHQHFNDSTDCLEQMLEEKTLEANYLAHQEKALSQQDEMINHRYTNIHTNLQKLDEKMLSLTGDLSAQQQQINDYILELEQQISLTENDMAQQYADDGNQQEIKRLLLVQQEGYIAQLKGLKEMQAVMRGEKVFFDSHGRPTQSLAHAHFVMPSASQYKIARDEHGNYYLLSKNQNIHHLSQADKEIAKEKYSRESDKILTIKEQIKHNEKLERHLHLQQKEDYQRSQQQLKLDIKYLQSQLQKVQATKAVIQHEMTKPAPNLQRVVQMQAASAPQANQSLQQLLTAIATNPTQTNITNFNNQLELNYGKQAQQAIGCTLIPGQPVTAARLRQINIQLSMLGVQNYNQKNHPEETPAPQPEKVKPGVC